MSYVAHDSLFTLPRPRAKEAPLTIKLGVHVSDGGLRALLLLLLRLEALLLLAALVVASLLLLLLLLAALLLLHLDAAASGRFGVIDRFLALGCLIQVALLVVVISALLLHRLLLRLAVVTTVVAAISTATDREASRVAALAALLLIASLLLRLLRLLRWLRLHRLAGLYIRKQVTQLSGLLANIVRNADELKSCAVTCHLEKGSEI